MSAALTSPVSTLVCVCAGFGALVSGCSTVELPSKQVLPQATAGARARAQDNEAAGVAARLPSSSSSSSTTQPGPKSRCHQPEPENTSRHLDDLGPIHLDHALPRSTPPRLDAAMTWLCSSHLNFIAALGFNSEPLGSALPLRTNESSYSGACVTVSRLS